MVSKQDKKLKIKPTMKNYFTHILTVLNYL